MFVHSFPPLSVMDFEIRAVLVLRENNRVRIDV